MAEAVVAPLEEIVAVAAVVKEEPFPLAVAEVLFHPPVVEAEEVVIAVALAEDEGTSVEAAEAVAVIFVEAHAEAAIAEALVADAVADVAEMMVRPSTR